MKKILLSLVVLFLLAGCSSQTITVSNPDENLIEGSASFTKQELFEKMRLNDYTTVVVSDIYDKLAELENLDKAELEKNAEASIEAAKKQLGENFQMFVEYSGGEEALKETSYISEVVTKLNRNYFDGKKDELVKEYRPVKAKIIYFDNEAKANQTLKDVKGGKSLEVSAAKNGYSSKIEEQVYTDKSDISLEVKTYLKTTKLGISDVIKSTVTATDKDGKTSTSDRYYLVEITNVNVDDFLNEFYDTIAKDYDAPTVLNSYLEKHEVEIYDQTTYDLLSSTYEALR